MEVGTSEASIDFSIFENKSECNNKSPSKCKSIYRILSGLLYYQLLNKRNKEQESGHAIFTAFLLEQYPHYLDDLIHLNTKHENDLEQIHDLLLKHPQFKSCDIDQCIFINRHCQIRDNNNNINNEVESLSLFHIQKWDAVHYQLLHLFQLSLRQRVTNDNSDGDIDKDEFGVIDNRMNKQSEQIRISRKKLGRFFGRFGAESNKFTIEATKSFSSPQSTNEQTRTICIRYKYII